MIFTHCNPYEHILEVLQNRVLQFDSRLKGVLPYETCEQQELFDHLNFAYIGGRYRSEEEFLLKRNSWNIGVWKQKNYFI